MARLEEEEEEDLLHLGRRRRGIKLGQE